MFCGLSVSSLNLKCSHYPDAWFLWCYPRLLFHLLNLRIYRARTLTTLLSPICHKSFNALNSRWTKYIKWNALSYFAEKTTDNKSLSEKEIRETLEQGIYLTKEELNCEHEYMNDQQNFDGYLLDAFLNSITRSYDPHSAFFYEPIKDNFEESF